MKKLLTSILAVVILLTSVSGICLADSMPASWALREVNLARMGGIITDAVTENYQASITREQFCELVVKLYEKLTDMAGDSTGNIFTDTDNPEVLKAYNIGIIKGVTDTEFAPLNNISRQEICTMLVRCIDKAMEDEDVDKYNQNVFADIGSIKDWALPSVQYAFDNGIMQGVGVNKVGEKMINPLGNTTCQEAILLTYRVYARYTDDDIVSESEVCAAYFDLLTELVEKHGICDNVLANEGLFLAKLIDFDNDGIDEFIYYHNTFETNCGYVVYKYNQVTKKAELLHDHRTRILEVIHVSIYRGQDGKIYVKTHDGQSYEYKGDYCTLESNEWKKVLYWTEFLDDDFHLEKYSFNGGAFVSRTQGESELKKYEKELLYEFELLGSSTGERPTGNINQMLAELKLKSES